MRAAQPYRSKPLPGQWWERLGYVQFLPPGMDPNDDPDYQGWVQVTEQRAREVFDARPRYPDITELADFVNRQPRKSQSVN